MQAADRRWSLFGLNLAQSLNFVRAGWRELFWGRASGIRARLEHPVALTREDGSGPDWYVAEVPLDRPPVTATGQAFTACQLPDEHVLVRDLVLPESLEADLENTIALEVRANSPFAEDDTSWGWTIQRRDNGQLEVSLAMAATSSVMEFLRERGYDPGERDHLPEVWCFAGANRHPVVLRGFGEQHRSRAYRRRLLRLGGVSAWLLLAMLGVLAVPGLVRDLQADNMERHHRNAREAASRAMELRQELSAHNERLTYLQQRLQNRVDYHGLLNHLTAQAGDETYIYKFEAHGNEVSLHGDSSDAAAFMQTLTEDPRYRKVRAPSAIRREPRTGLERFSLELRLKGGNEQS